jgi:hypothetical protein
MQLFAVLWFFACGVLAAAWMLAVAEFSGR